MHDNVSAITPTKIVDSKWQDNKMNYTSWPIILPNMKDIAPINDLRGMDKPKKYIPILSYAAHKKKLNHA